MRSKDKYRIVSLFSGIGGFEEGVRMSNMSASIVFASEIDRHASYSYVINNNMHHLCGDITEIDEMDIPDHEILCAGFPCQSFSIAGNQKGFNDIRGTLFFDVARILKEKKPRFILLENVKNIISHNKSKTIYTILNILHELNYTVDFTVINSNEAGLPQSRERMYIIGIYNGKICDYTTDYRNKKVDSLKKEINNKHKFKTFNFFDSLKIKNREKFLIDIMDNVVDTRYYFNTEKISTYLSSLTIEYEKCKTRKIIKMLDLPKEVHNDLERQRRVYSPYGISPTILARSDTTKVLLNKKNEYKIRKLTPKEALRVQGFSELFIENLIKSNISDTQLYKQAGNAVSPPIVADIFNHLLNYVEINHEKI